MRISDYRSLAQVLPHQVEHRPEATAIVFEGRRVSYAELGRGAERVAAALQARGVGPGDRVAVLSRNTVRFFETLFGAVRLGALVAPINWRLATAEIDHIVSDLDPSVVVYEPDFGAAVEDRRWPVTPALVRSDDPGLDATGAPPPVAGGGAVCFYTSGTTGRPKGVVLRDPSFAKLCTGDPTYPDWWRCRDDDVSLVAMPTFHVGGLESALRSVFSGGVMVLLREFDPASAVAAIAEHRPTQLVLVPTALQILLRHPAAAEVDFTCVRTFYYGASAIPAGLLRVGLERMGCDFVGCYGMTEAAGTVVALAPADHDPGRPDRMASTGRPLPGVEVRVVDADGADVAAGRTGEILMRSPFTMAGYWRRPEASAETVDASGWLHSGDAGSLDADGYLTIRDRVKDMIVSGAENVYPAEVENAIHSHPDVVEVAVIGVPHALWGEAVRAVVVPVPGATVTEDAIIGWARERLAGYKTPKSVLFVPALPRNASGKVLKRELRLAHGGTAVAR